MKHLALGLLFALWSSLAFAQGCGPTNPNCIVPTAPVGTNNNQAASTAYVLQNGASSTAFDLIFGSTRGSILERGATGWAIVPPGTSGLPWVSNGTGADPGYQGLANSGLAAAGAQNTVKGAATSTAIADLTVPSCSSAGNALQWTTNTGFGCASGVSSIAGNTGAFTLGNGLTNSVNNILVSAGTGITVAGGSVATNLSTVTNTIGADVALNNTGSYFDGPTVAQGTSGTWLATGTVTFLDTSAGANFAVKLGDGTTIIDSSAFTTSSANILGSISLSGILASPVANIRMSVRDLSTTSGVIKFNASGNGKDGTLTVIRIQ